MAAHEARFVTLGGSQVCIRIRWGVGVGGGGHGGRA